MVRSRDGLTDGSGIYDPTLFAYTTVTRAITASTTKAGATFSAPKSGNIRYIGTSFSALSGSPALDLRVETLSSSLPTGTLWGTNTNAAFSPTLTSTFVWTQLAADAAVTAGDFFAAVVGYTSGTSATSVYAARNFEGGVLLHPESLVMVAGTWLKDQHTPMICVKYDDGTIVRGCVPANQHIQNTFGSGSSPNERASVFSPACPSFLLGVRAVMNLQTTSAFSLNLYKGTSTTPVSGGTITVGAGNVVNAASGLATFWFPEPIFLETDPNGQNYRVSILATAAATLATFRYTFPSTAERDVVFGELWSDTRAGSSWIGESTTTSEMIIPIVGSGAAWWSRL